MSLMSGLFSLFQRKKTAKQGSTLTVSQLDDEQKIMIDEYMDEGLKSSEISQNTGLPIEVIYRYGEIRKRRLYRQGFTGNDLRDTQEQLKIQKIKHELETQKRMDDLEMEKLKLDIEDQRADMQDEEVNGDGEPGWPDLIKFLNNLLEKKGETSPGGSTDPAPGLPPATMPGLEKDLTDEQIRDLISKIDPTYIDMAKSLPKKTVRSFIQKKYPISNKSIDRALEIINNGI